MKDRTIEQLIVETAQILTHSKYLVGFTGAGVSTESGLSDFRGPDGVWTRRDKGLPPKPNEKSYDEIRPNPSHMAFVDLYKLGILKFLVSQNVDNLHRLSGIPRNILAELHGNHAYMRCLRCQQEFLLTEVGWDRQLYGSGYRTQKPRPNQPCCPNCQGQLISSIVNFGDPLPEKDFTEAYEHSKKADVYLVAGSSLCVTPAANLPRDAALSGTKLIIINMEPTPLDDIATIVIKGKTGKILPEIVNKIKTYNQK